MALYIKESDKGSIRIHRLVIGGIVVKAVKKFAGRVKITNYKGKIIRLKEKYGIPDGTEYLDISIDEKGINVRIYIAIRFGTSISSVTEQLIGDVKSDIELLTGIEVNSIAVVVTGLISKQIAPRNIEVIG